MAVIINDQPLGTVPPGGTFSYDLRIEVAGLLATENGLAFRPRDYNAGTMSPSRAPLVSATFTCSQEAFSPVPTTTWWGAALLILGIGAAAVAYLTVAGRSSG